MKYGPHDVVKAKRDLKKCSDGIVQLSKEKDELNDDKKSLQTEIDQKRACLVTLDNSFAVKLNSFADKIRSLVGEVERLVEAKKGLAGINNTLRGDIKKQIDKPLPEIAFATSVLSSLRQELESIESQKEALIETVDELSVTENAKRSSLKKLKSEIKTSLKALSFLIIGNKKGNEKNAKLGKEYLRLEKKIQYLLTKK